MGSKENHTSKKEMGEKKRGSGQKAFYQKQKKKKKKKTKKKTSKPKIAKDFNFRNRFYHNLAIFVAISIQILTC